VAPCTWYEQPETIVPRETERSYGDSSGEVKAWLRMTFPAWEALHAWWKPPALAGGKQRFSAAESRVFILFSGALALESGAEAPKEEN